MEVRIPFVGEIADSFYYSRCPNIKNWAEKEFGYDLGAEVLLLDNEENPNNYDYFLSFQFASSDEAMLFKLRWA